MIIRIQRRIWSQNQRDRSHWSRQRKERDHWRWLIMGQLGARQQPPEHRRSITLISYRAQLIADHANLVGGAKDLVDALVHVGLLKDDADGWANLRYEQKKCRRAEEHTAIVVHDLDMRQSQAQKRRAARRTGNAVQT